MQAKWVPHKKSRREDFNNTIDVRRDASRYLKAHVFIERMRKFAHIITMNEYRELREQALNGDIHGAEMKLDDILRRR